MKDSKQITIDGHGIPVTVIHHSPKSHEYIIGKLGEPEKKIVWKALKEMKAVINSDGSKSWLEDIVEFDSSAVRPSERYTWNKKGDRIKHKRFLVTKSAKGEISRESWGHVWKAWE